MRKKTSVNEMINKPSASSLEGNPNYRMLGDGYYVSNNSHETWLNNNDIVCASAGRNKTTGYVEPLISQKCGSMIISDSKNYLYEKHAQELRDAGYKVYKLDMVSGEDSCSYNVLEYVRYDPEMDTYNERDIVALSHMLCRIDDDKDPFWRSSAEIFLSSLIAFVLEATPLEEHHMGTINKLFGLLNDFKKYDNLMKEHLSEFPESFAVARYYRFKSVAMAEKTYSCIVMFVANAINNFDCRETKNIFYKRNSFDFESIGREKTALFLNVSDTDGSMDTIIGLFYRDMLGKLMRYADRLPEKRLPVPVRFIIDDFSSGTIIEDFDRIISVIRSREISCSIIIQSLSQLESLYTEAGAATIISNCDHLLFLGTTEVRMAEYISKKLNVPYQKVLNMPMDEAYLFESGNTRGGIKLKKYIPPYMRKGITEKSKEV